MSRNKFKPYEMHGIFSPSYDDVRLALEAHYDTQRIAKNRLTMKWWECDCYKGLEHILKVFPTIKDLSAPLLLVCFKLYTFDSSLGYMFDDTHFNATYEEVYGNDTTDTIF